MQFTDDGTSQPNIGFARAIPGRTNNVTLPVPADPGDDWISPAFGAQPSGIQVKTLWRQESSIVAREEQWVRVPGCLKIWQPFHYTSASAGSITMRLCEIRDVASFSPTIDPVVWEQAGTLLTGTNRVGVIQLDVSIERIATGPVVRATGVYILSVNTVCVAGSEVDLGTRNVQVGPDPTFDGERSDGLNYWNFANGRRGLYWAANASVAGVSVRMLPGRYEFLNTGMGGMNQ